VLPLVLAPVERRRRRPRHRNARRARGAGACLEQWAGRATTGVSGSSRAISKKRGAGGSPKGSRRRTPRAARFEGRESSPMVMGRSKARQATRDVEKLLPRRAPRSSGSARSGEDPPAARSQGGPPSRRKTSLDRLMANHACWADPRKEPDGDARGGCGLSETIAEGGEQRKASGPMGSARRHDATLRAVPMREARAAAQPRRRGGCGPCRPSSSRARTRSVRVAHLLRPEHFYSKRIARLRRRSRARDGGRPSTRHDCERAWRARARAHAAGRRRRVPPADSDATPSGRTSRRHAISSSSSSRVVRHLIAALRADRRHGVRRPGSGDALRRRVIKQVIERTRVARDSTETGAAANRRAVVREIYQAARRQSATAWGMGSRPGRRDRRATGRASQPGKFVMSRPGRHGPRPLRPLARAQHHLGRTSTSSRARSATVRTSCDLQHGEDGGRDRSQLACSIRGSTTSAKRNQLSADEWQRFIDAWDGVS